MRRGKRPSWLCDSTASKRENDSVEGVSARFVALQGSAYGERFFSGRRPSENSSER